MIARPPARPMRLVLASLAASVVIALAPAGAGAATRTVKMEANSFNPSSVSIARGDTVKWSNKGGFLEHDVTSTRPARYFKSGRAGGIDIGETWSYTFRSAGRFLYVCSIHVGMDGSVSVPISVTKLTGPVRFRVTVATRSASSPWRHQVQVKKPGSSSFQTIATTSSATVTWKPPKRGTYTFRSRVLSSTTGAASDWSPTASKTW